MHSRAQILYQSHTVYRYISKLSCFLIYLDFPPPFLFSFPLILFPRLFVSSLFHSLFLSACSLVSLPIISYLAFSSPFILIFPPSFSSPLLSFPLAYVHLSFHHCFPLVQLLLLSSSLLLTYMLIPSLSACLSLNSSSSHLPLLSFFSDASLSIDCLNFRFSPLFHSHLLCASHPFPPLPLFSCQPPWSLLFSLLW